VQKERAFLLDLALAGSKHPGTEPLSENQVFEIKNLEGKKLWEGGDQLGTSQATLRVEIYNLKDT